MLPSNRPYPEDDLYCKWRKILYENKLTDSTGVIDRKISKLSIPQLESSTLIPVLSQLTESFTITKKESLLFFTHQVSTLLKQIEKEVGIKKITLGGSTTFDILSYRDKKTIYQKALDHIWGLNKKKIGKSSRDILIQLTPKKHINDIDLFIFLRDKTILDSPTSPEHPINKIIKEISSKNLPTEKGIGSPAYKKGAKILKGRKPKVYKNAHDGIDIPYFLVKEFGFQNLRFNRGTELNQLDVISIALFDIAFVKKRKRKAGLNTLDSLTIDLTSSLLHDDRKNFTLSSKLDNGWCGLIDRDQGIMRRSDSYFTIANVERYLIGYVKGRTIADENEIQKICEILEEECKLNKIYKPEEIIYQLLQRASKHLEPTPDSAGSLLMQLFLLIEGPYAPEDTKSYFNDNYKAIIQETKELWNDSCYCSLFENLKQNHISMKVALAIFQLETWELLLVGEREIFLTFEGDLQGKKPPYRMKRRVNERETYCLLPIYPYQALQVIHENRKNKSMLPLLKTIESIKPTTKYHMHLTFFSLPYDKMLEVSHSLSKEDEPQLQSIGKNHYDLTKLLISRESKIEALQSIFYSTVTIDPLFAMQIFLKIKKNKVISTNGCIEVVLKIYTQYKKRRSEPELFHLLKQLFFECLSYEEKCNLSEKKQKSLLTFLSDLAKDSYFVLMKNIPAIADFLITTNPSLLCPLSLDVLDRILQNQHEYLREIATFWKEANKKRIWKSNPKPKEWYLLTGKLLILLYNSEVESNFFRSIESNFFKSKTPKSDPYIAINTKVDKSRFKRLLKELKDPEFAKICPKKQLQHFNSEKKVQLNFTICKTYLNNGETDLALKHYEEHTNKRLDPIHSLEFIETILELASACIPINGNKKWIEKGFLILYDAIFSTSYCIHKKITSQVIDFFEKTNSISIIDCYPVGNKTVKYLLEIVGKMQDNLLTIRCSPLILQYLSNRKISENNYDECHELILLTLEALRKDHNLLFIQIFSLLLERFKKSTVKKEDQTFFCMHLSRRDCFDELLGSTDSLTDYLKTTEHIKPEVLQEIYKDLVIRELKANQLNSAIRILSLIKFDDSLNKWVVITLELYEKQIFSDAVQFHTFLVKLYTLTKSKKDKKLIKVFFIRICKKLCDERKSLRREELEALSNAFVEMHIFNDTFWAFVINQALTYKATKFKRNILVKLLKLLKLPEANESLEIDFDSLWDSASKLISVASEDEIEDLLTNHLSKLIPQNLSDSTSLNPLTFLIRRCCNLNYTKQNKIILLTYQSLADKITKTDTPIPILEFNIAILDQLFHKKDPDSITSKLDILHNSLQLLSDCLIDQIQSSLIMLNKKDKKIKKSRRCTKEVYNFGISITPACTDLVKKIENHLFDSLTLFLDNLDHFKLHKDKNLINKLIQIVKETPTNMFSNKVLICFLRLIEKINLDTYIYLAVNLLDTIFQVNKFTEDIEDQTKFLASFCKRMYCRLKEGKKESELKQFFALSSYPLFVSIFQNPTHRNRKNKDLLTHTLLVEILIQALNYSNIHKTIHSSEIKKLLDSDTLSEIRLMNSIQHVYDRKIINKYLSSLSHQHPYKIIEVHTACYKAILRDFSDTVIVDNLIRYFSSHYTPEYKYNQFDCRHFVTQLEHLMLPLNSRTKLKSFKADNLYNFVSFILCELLQTASVIEKHQIQVIVDYLIFIFFQHSDHKKVKTDIEQIVMLTKKLWIQKEKSYTNTPLELFDILSSYEVESYDPDKICDAINKCLLVPSIQAISLSFFILAQTYELIDLQSLVEIKSNINHALSHRYIEEKELADLFIAYTKNFINKYPKPAADHPYLKLLNLCNHLCYIKVNETRKVGDKTGIFMAPNFIKLYIALLKEAKHCYFSKENYEQYLNHVSYITEHIANLSLFNFSNEEKAICLYPKILEKPFDDLLDLNESFDDSPYHQSFRNLTYISALKNYFSTGRKNVFYRIAAKVILDRYPDCISKKSPEYPFFYEIKEKFTKK